MPDKKKRPTRTVGGLVRVVGYLSESDYDRFEEFSDREQMPKSLIIRIAIREYLRRRHVDSETDR